LYRLKAENGAGKAEKGFEKVGYGLVTVFFLPVHRSDTPYHPPKRGHPRARKGGGRIYIPSPKFFYFNRPRFFYFLRPEIAYSTKFIFLKFFILPKRGDMRENVQGQHTGQRVEI
jgi:hypothetical protein